MYYNDGWVAIHSHHHTTHTHILAYDDDDVSNAMTETPSA